MLLSTTPKSDKAPALQGKHERDGHDMRAPKQRQTLGLKRIHELVQAMLDGGLHEFDDDGRAAEAEREVQSGLRYIEAAIEEADPVLIQRPGKDPEICEIQSVRTRKGGSQCHLWKVQSQDHEVRPKGRHDQGQMGALCPKGSAEGHQDDGGHTKMTTPMHVYVEIAARYGVDPTDDEAIDAWWESGMQALPEESQAAIGAELLERHAEASPANVAPLSTGD